jgi:hypothetical protein
VEKEANRVLPEQWDLREFKVRKVLKVNKVRKVRQVRKVLKVR